MKILVIALLVLKVLPSENKVRYDNFKVYRVTPKTKEAAKTLHHLEINSNNFDFWSRVSAIDHPVDIMVAPHLDQEFNETIFSDEFKAEVLIHNVQTLIDNENPKLQGRAIGDFGWTSYHTLDEINAWLQSLAENYPDRVTLRKAGKTYLERDIVGVQLTFAPDRQSRSVFIEGNIHAREWITSAVATWIINELLTSEDPAVRALAESHEWYIFPVVNPDGFTYTHERYRSWRKTRKTYGDYYGADPNRNWDYEFGGGGTSPSPSSDTYRGPYPFSEPCTASVSQFISTIGHNLEAFISFHSYGQLLLIPYGYTAEHLDNYDQAYSVGEKAMQTLARRYGTQYRIGNVPEVLYVAAGGTMDWVKGTFQTPIVYTYELRDTGRYGFILPADQIIPTAEETFDSFITIFEEFDQILQGNGN